MNKNEITLVANINVVLIAPQKLIKITKKVRDKYGEWFSIRTVDTTKLVIDNVTPVTTASYLALLKVYRHYYYSETLNLLYKAIKKEDRHLLKIQVVYVYDVHDNHILDKAKLKLKKGSYVISDWTLVYTEKP